MSAGRVRRCGTGLLALLAASLTTPVRADEADDDAVGWGDSGDVQDTDDDAVGWGGDDTDTRKPAAAAAEPPAAPSPLTLQAKVRERVGLWTRRSAHPLAQARSSLELLGRYGLDFASWSLRLVAGVRAEYDAAYLVERERYDAPELETYEWQVIGGETYLQLGLGDLELALGRQVLPLGQGEVLGVLDVLSPRDLREPGLAEPGELRMAVLSSRLAYFAGDHRFELIAVHEAQFGLLPPPLSTFSPLRRLILEDPLARDVLAQRTWRFRHRPEGFDPQVWQYMARYGITGHGFDLDFFAGSVLDKLGVAQLPAAAEFSQPQLQLSLSHPRYELVGLAGSVAAGAVLLRWELSGELDRAHTVRSRTISLDFATQRHTQLNGLLGATYFAGEGSTLGLEWQQGYVLGSPDEEDGVELLWPVEQPVLAARWNGSWLRDRLQVRALAISIGLSEWVGLVVRLEVGYLLADGLELALGYALYHAGDAFGPFYGFNSHDRVFATLRADLMLID